MLFRSDSYALGLKVAQQLIDDKIFETIISDRYSSFTKGIGKEIVDGTTDFKKLEKYALDLPEIKNESAQLEVIKGTLNQYLLRAFSK